MAEADVAVIRHVTLYKHGVGFFKREAQVEGDSLIELQFKSKEMNDVLKSRTVYDADGGLIPAVSYEGRRNESLADDVGLDLPDSPDPEEFSAGISADNALTGLLARLVGVKVAFEAGGVEIRGDILGLERVPLDANRPQASVGAVACGSGGELDGGNACVYHLEHPVRGRPGLPAGRRGLRRSSAFCSSRDRFVYGRRRSAPALFESVSGGRGSLSRETFV